MDIRGESNKTRNFFPKKVCKQGNTTGKYIPCSILFINFIAPISLSP